MDEIKGVIKPEGEILIAKALDEFFKFKNPILEGGDYMFFLFAVKAIDNNGIDRIHPSWKERLIPVVDAALVGNKEEVRRLATDLMNAKIDIPKVDEETELVLFDSFTKFIAAAIDHYVTKKKLAA